jgi:hypothetical protein
LTILSIAHLLVIYKLTRNQFEIQQQDKPRFDQLLEHEKEGQDDTNDSHYNVGNTEELVLATQPASSG